MFIMPLTVPCEKTNLTFVVISYNILLNSFKMLLSLLEARLITFLIKALKALELIVSQKSLRHHSTMGNVVVDLS